MNFLLLIKHFSIHKFCLLQLIKFRFWECCPRVHYFFNSYKKITTKTTWKYLLIFFAYSNYIFFCIIAHISLPENNFNYNDKNNCGLNIITIVMFWTYYVYIKLLFFSYIFFHNFSAKKLFPKIFFFIIFFKKHNNLFLLLLFLLLFLSSSMKK